VEKNGATENQRGEGAFWRCETLLASGKHKKAVEALAEVAAKFVDWKERALYAQIKILMSIRETKKLIQKMENFLKELPSSKLIPEITFLYAIALKNDGRLKDAELQFAKFARKYPDNEYAPRALFEEGVIALGYERCSVAITAFRLFCEKYLNNPLIPNVKYREIYALLSEHRDKEALEDVNFLATNYPKSKYTIHALFRLGEYFREKKLDENAIATYKKAESLAMMQSCKSFAANAVYEIANIYFLADKTQMALKTLNELSEKYPKQRAEAYGLFLRGDIF
jgi:TolA-binding protein